MRRIRIILIAAAVAFRAAALTIVVTPDCSQHSMEPLIRQGDRVFVEVVPFSQIKAHDVILFTDDRGTILHEVSYVVGDHVCVKTDGIHNHYSDSGFLYPSHYIGKAILLVRHGHLIPLP